MKRKALVLIVDDEAFHRYTTRMMLHQAGFDVKEAATGQEGLRLAEEHPDLVLLDLHLPDISGVEICRRLKQTPSTADIRVVHVTAAYLGSAERREAMEAGSDGYLMRPIDAEQLLATVKAVLTRHAA
ncbi:MAG TPA: response regulator [Methylomirabilota bacterium]|jgi:CheY-like chemotaxis protein|nr:response regulator [Methylomirabilota bacterium]